MRWLKESYARSERAYYTNADFYRLANTLQWSHSLTLWWNSITDSRLTRRRGFNGATALRCGGTHWTRKGYYR
jgi:hypothetical protein